MDSSMLAQFIMAEPILINWGRKIHATNSSRNILQLRS
jgi:hypothetical protein